MKKIALFLCAVLLWSLAAGCGSPVTAETTVPGQEQVVLTIGVVGSDDIEDYETNAFTRWLREETGFDIRIRLLSGYYSERFVKALAEGESVPDIIWNCQLSREVTCELGQYGYLQDLTPYFEDREKSGVFWQRMELLNEEQQDLLLRRMTSEDGHIYAFPTAESPGDDTIGYHTYINTAWLEKLELEMPTDPESLYRVLMAFRDRDPNGNGRRDEVPLIGSTGYPGGDLIGWIVNMFVYCDESRWFNVGENGQLYLPHTTDAYREALIYIRRLIDEGLLKGWKMTSDAVKLNVCPPEGEPVTVGAFVGDADLCTEPGHAAVGQYGVIPYWGHAVRGEAPLSCATYITSACQNIDAAWAVLMKMCSREGALRLRYGEYGVDWVEASDGSGAALLRDVYGKPNNAVWGSISATFLLDEDCAWKKAEQADVDAHAAGAEPGAGGSVRVMSGVENAFLLAEEENAPARRMPLLLYGTELLQERTDCVKLIESARMGFLSGIGEFTDPSDDTQWEAYLFRLRETGAEEWRKQAEGMASEIKVQN